MAVVFGDYQDVFLCYIKMRKENTPRPWKVNRQAGGVLCGRAKGIGEREEDGRKKPAEVRWGTTERMERRTQMQPAAGGARNAPSGGEGRENGGCAQRGASPSMGNKTVRSTFLKAAGMASWCLGLTENIPRSQSTHKIPISTDLCRCFDSHLPSPGEKIFGRGGHHKTSNEVFKMPPRSDVEAD